MGSLARDTTEADGYCVCKLVDGVETFFEHKGLSYGRGRTWTLTPKQRKGVDLELPLDLVTMMMGKKKPYRAKRRKRLSGREEYLHLNTPEFLDRLQVLLKAWPLPDPLPEDAIVGRCEIEPDGFGFDHHSRQAVHPYEADRSIVILVLSNTYDEVGEAKRHPNLDGGYRRTVSEIPDSLDDKTYMCPDDKHEWSGRVTRKPGEETSCRHCPAQGAWADDGSMILPEPDEVTVGSRWQHKNDSGPYIVIALANTAHRHPDHPVHVVYKSGENWWSRPLSQWHEKFHKWSGG